MKTGQNVLSNCLTTLILRCAGRILCGSLLYLVSLATERFGVVSGVLYLLAIASVASAVAVFCFRCVELRNELRMPVEALSKATNGNSSLN